MKKFWLWWEKKGAKIIWKVFYGFCILFFSITVLDLVTETVRGWRNKEGVSVDVFWLYEKRIRSRHMEEIFKESERYMDSLIPKQLRELTQNKRQWEMLNHWQFRFYCDYVADLKQSEWIKERGKLKHIRRYKAKDSPLLYDYKELPEIRYRCSPGTIFYRAGMGWGIF